MKKRNLLTKVLAMALVLMLATGLFAGCGKEEQPAEQQPTGTEEGAKPDEQKPEEQAQSKPEWGGLTLPIVDKPLELTMWMPLEPKRANIIKDMSEMPTVQELEKRTGIKIKWINPPSAQATEQFNLMMASQDLPDMISHNWTDPVRYAQDGAIVPLNELIEKNAPNFSRILEQFPQARKEITMDDGNIYYMGVLRIPWGGINGNSISLPRMIIRQDWLDKVGKKVPTTLDEWYDVLKAFKAAGDLNGNGKADEIPFTANRFALGNGMGDISIQAALIRPYGIIPGFYQIDGKAYFGALQPEYKEAVTMIRKWYGEGLIDHDFLIQDLNQLDAKVYNGQVGSMYGLSIRHFAKGNDSMGQNDPNAKFVVAPFPKAMDGNSKVYNFETQAAQIATPKAVAITSANEHPEESVKWLDYMYSPEGALLAEFGIEGKTYKIENGKLVSKWDEVAKEEGISVEQVNGKYKINYNAWSAAGMPLDPADPWYKEAGFDFKIDMISENSDIQQLSKYGWTADWAIADAKSWDTSRVLPPVSFTPEESKQVTTKMTEIGTYVTDMFAKFVTGQEPLTKFDDFTTQLKNMGIEDVLKVYQAALDRYNKR